MKFFITGAAGLIGHNVVRILEPEHDILAIDNFTNYHNLVEEEQMQYLHKERLNRIKSRVHYADITDQLALSEITQGHQFDCIVHLASFPRQKVVNKNPASGARVMVEGLINLLELAVEKSVKRFVYISSSMVYGDFPEQTTEDRVCCPIGQYGIMKYMGEKLVQDYARKHGFEYVIIRPSAVYGEYDVEDRVISKFMLAALRNQTLKVKGQNELLDFTYVEDAAKGICLSATKQQAANQTYNITKGASLTLLEAAKLAIKIAGQGQLVVEDKDQDFPSRASLSIQRARDHLGFDPQVTVEEGFHKYYTWLKSSTYFNVSS